MVCNSYEICFELSGTNLKRSLKSFSRNFDIFSICVPKLNSEYAITTVNSPFKKVHFPFLNRELFDSRKIYVMNLNTARPKKMPYVGEFAT